MSSIDFEMDVFTICGLAVCTAAAAITLKQFRPELALQVSAAGGTIMLLLTVGRLSGVLSSLKEVFNESGVDEAWLVLILKIAGISYITQISAELCRDAGESALACKTELCGRIMILVCAMPAVVSLTGIIAGLTDLIS